jgi:uncharacterized protein YdhG (YjbR/CyaY superfamily)
MAKTDYQSVDDYIGAQPKRAQAVLQRVRGVIRKALPEAEEVISYQIPAYKAGGSAVIYFAGWKEHYSLYPVTGRLVGAFGDELAKYVVSKGTVRFPLDDRVPVRLIERIAKFRAEEELARRQAKARAKGGSKTGAKAGPSSRSEARSRSSASPRRAAAGRRRRSARR